MSLYLLSSFYVTMAQITIFVALFYLFFDLLQCYDTKLPKPYISLQCEKEGICERVHNYPTKLVKELIYKLISQNTIFNYDKALMPTINMRFNDEDLLSLCDTKPKFSSPQAAKDKNGNWQFIINNSEDPLQVFRVELCKLPMGRCSENIGFIPGYDGACIQKMVFREMFYINETKGIGKTNFAVPSCCSCTVFRKDSDK